MNRPKLNVNGMHTTSQRAPTLKKDLGLGNETMNATVSVRFRSDRAMAPAKAVAITQ